MTVDALQWVAIAVLAVWVWALAFHADHRAKVQQKTNDDPRARRGQRP